MELGQPQPGRSHPIGARVYPGGVNFCVFSKNCTALELLFFDDVDDARPSHTFTFDPRLNRTFYYWHMFIPGVQAGQLYAYRAHGPYKPEEGLFFDGQKVLLDPYARGIAVGRNYDRQAAARPGDNAPYAMKNVVVDSWAYNWEGDHPLQRDFRETVIYELHVGNFTGAPSSGLPEALRGTYAGLIEKIPYLKRLGITAIELLPVQQFDPQDAPEGKRNVWGYSPIGFFAPHALYSARRDPLGPVEEFRALVKACHRAGIEVILDVVFNHTAEGDEHGPTLCFRGLENRAYYIPHQGRWPHYANFTGCSNTLNANHSIVRRLIRDCLRYWVREMHVDGFRFDLASVLTRDEWGHPLPSPPLLWEIESDPVLAGTKIIAEAWDAAGLYQVGSFIGHRWAEWNGRFRDDVRRFWRGDEGTVRAFAARLNGSPDLYPQPDREPNRSINFVTCHDGFTLHDLVSYNTKHNEANGEANRDGADENFSWNCGVEGPTDDPNILALRQRQMRNFFTTLLLAQGTPMLLMGDEIARTQQGNNNAYCQEGPLVWFDWSALATRQDLWRFVQGLLSLKQAHPALRAELFWSPDPQAPLQIIWHGVTLNDPDWSHVSHSLAFELRWEGRPTLYAAFNAYWEPLTFELPFLPPGLSWRRIVDTSRPTPEDYTPPEHAQAVRTPTYTLPARSTLVLLTGPL